MPFLFSYGTLQDPEVQRATFGRSLAGSPDALPGHTLGRVELSKARAAANGRSHHVNAEHDKAGRIDGTLLEVTDAELAQIDAYEAGDSYARREHTLASGRTAWVFAHVLPIDHLVYLVADLERGMDDIEERFGVRPVMGGSHSGRGTRNALLTIGPRAYLELLAQDPNQPSPNVVRWFHADEPEPSRLVGWALASREIDAAAAEAAAAGAVLGYICGGTRRRDDGTMLRWRFTDPRTEVEGGVVPFLIDWGGSPHPSEAAPGGVTLRALRARHPEPERVRAMLVEMSAPIRVERGERPMLIAEFDTPRGPVTLE